MKWVVAFEGLEGVPWWIFVCLWQFHICCQRRKSVCFVRHVVATSDSVFLSFLGPLVLWSVGPHGPCHLCVFTSM